MTSTQIPLIFFNTPNESLLPKYATSGSAGMDLLANIEEPLTIAPSEIKLISTGIAIALPINFEAQIRSRSGLALKHGIVVLNAPGTIDSDYRGEIKVILINHSKENYTVNPQDRIAQMVISKYETISWDIVTTLDTTERQEGGFGSTGNNK